MILGRLRTVSSSLKQRSKTTRPTRDFYVYGGTMFPCVHCLICRRSYAEHERRRKVRSVTLLPKVIDWPLKAMHEAVCKLQIRVHNL